MTYLACLFAFLFSFVPQSLFCQSSANNQSLEVSRWGGMELGIYSGPVADYQSRVVMYDCDILFGNGIDGSSEDKSKLAGSLKF